MGKLLWAIDGRQNYDRNSSASNTGSTAGSGNVSIGFTPNNLEGTKLSLELLSIIKTERKEEDG